MCHCVLEETTTAYNICTPEIIGLATSLMRVRNLFFLLFPAIYIILTCLAAYRLFGYRNAVEDLDPGSVDDINKLPGARRPEVIKKSHNINRSFILKENIYPNKKRRYNSTVQPTHVVEIWGKAAIGLYLWKHILSGELKELAKGFVKVGNLTVESITFVFRTGPGVVQTTVPQDVQNLVLVINGRSSEKIKFAQSWLDYLPEYKYLRKTALLVLGDEECNNQWLLPYMRSRGGWIDFVFIVYDSVLVDNVEFYQWPLGVAEYRGFPHIVPEKVYTRHPRSYMCNFMGTVYKNSSREQLVGIMESSKISHNCIIKPRDDWVPLESEDSLNAYVKALLDSDLTLNPVGKNTECYRIYEALMLGSVPVVEDVLTPGNCDSVSSATPLRLLKKYFAPIIYVKDWNNLPHILQKETMLSESEKVERRLNVLKWYKDFKNIMKGLFVSTIQSNFFV